MKKLAEFFKHEHIQISLATGVGIIALALFFKKIMHVKVPAIESALPALVLVAFEMLRAKKKLTRWPWDKGWFWGLLSLGMVGVIMLWHLWLAR